MNDIPGKSGFLDGCQVEENSDLSKESTSAVKDGEVDLCKAPATNGNRSTEKYDVSVSNNSKTCEDELPAVAFWSSTRIGLCSTPTQPSFSCTPVDRSNAPSSSRIWATREIYFAIMKAQERSSTTADSKSSFFFSAKENLLSIQRTLEYWCSVTKPYGIALALLIELPHPPYLGFKQFCPS